MDQRTRQRNSSHLRLPCTSKNPKSRSTMEVPKQSTPTSNLCNTLEDTALTSTEQIFSENVETMFVNAPQKSVQTNLNSSFLTPIESGSQALHLSRQTPGLSVKKLSLQNVEDTGSTTKGIPMQISKQAPACARLNFSSEKKNINSTPRRKPRRSYLERTLRQEEKQSNDVMNTSHLRNEICKSDSLLLTHVSSNGRNDITPCSSASMESECVVSGHKEENSNNILKNIKEQAKNSCKSSSPFTTTEYKETVKESVASCSNKRNYQSSDIQHNSDSPSTDLPPTPPFESFILTDVTAYVEVMSHNENISAGVRKELTKLGATVVQRFIKSVTHVVFNEGYVSTYQKAKKRNIPLVSVLWIEACRKAGVKVHEDDYLPNKLERYESPSEIKQLKKRRIVQFPFVVKPRRSRKRKEVPQHGDISPAIELSKEIPERKSFQLPKWADAVAGNNGEMRILFEITGISHREFENLVNRPETPDSDIELDHITPLPIRLLRKMAKNLPIGKNNCDDNSKTNDSSQLNSPSKNSFAKKLTAVTEIENEKVNEDQFVADNGDTSMVVENSQSISPDNSYQKNISHRKKESKRKQMSPVKETVVVTSDSDNMECTTVDNRHNCSAKNLSNSSLRKKKKLDSSKETNSTAVLGKKVTRKSILS